MVFSDDSYTARRRRDYGHSRRRTGSDGGPVATAWQPARVNRLPKERDKSSFCAVTGVTGVTAALSPRLGGLLA